MWLAFRYTKEGSAVWHSLALYVGHTAWAIKLPTLSAAACCMAGVVGVWGVEAGVLRL